jgi:ribosome-associated translation inhibitor RaiA
LSPLQKFGPPFARREVYEPIHHPAVRISVSSSGAGRRKNGTQHDNCCGTLFTGAKVRISVTGRRGAVDGRTRAYVEYRVFDTLRSVEREVRHVDVAVSDEAIDVPRVVRCSVILDIAAGEQIEATATADWPYAAIDRAVRDAWRQLSTRPREAMRS